MADTRQATGVAKRTGSVVVAQIQDGERAVTIKAGGKRAERAAAVVATKGRDGVWRMECVGNMARALQLTARNQRAHEVRHGGAVFQVPARTSLCLEVIR